MRTVLVSILGVMLFCAASVLAPVSAQAAACFNSGTPGPTTPPALVVDVAGVAGPFFSLVGEINGLPMMGSAFLRADGTVTFWVKSMLYGIQGELLPPGYTTGTWRETENDTSPRPFFAVPCPSLP